MSKLLFVKSGFVEQPVPDALELPVEELKNVVAGKNLKFLGEELPPIMGEADKMQDFRGPTYVVLQATETDLKALGISDVGMYEVEDLHPNAVPR